MFRAYLFVVLTPALLLAGSARAQSLPTRWTKSVTVDEVHSEYPRPHFVRDRWLNLNGMWQYAIAARDIERPTFESNQQILVPFPIESALSGVKKTVGDAQRLWYRRTFTVPGRSSRRLVVPSPNDGAPGRPAARRQQ